MSDRQSIHETSVVADMNQPLIAVLVEQNGKDVVRYFVDEAQADAVLGQDGTKQPIKLAGIWNDLDGEAMLADLERMRHASKPTPPLISL